MTRSRHSSSALHPSEALSAERWVVALLVAMLGVACGAKTGLDIPDASRDASRDTGVDAARPFVPPICIEVPPDDLRAVLMLEIPATLRVVDVMFLLDSSASMQDEIDQVRGRLRDVVVPGIRDIIPDAAFAVAIFGEFPVMPHAREGDDTGPFRMRTTMTTDVGRIEVALDETPVWGNLDDPEASIEGLYQVATGEGLSPWIMAGLGCAGGGVGGGCFRDDAFRIVMLATDAPMHNGPPTTAPLAPYSFMPRPHTYAQTLEAVEAADLFVIGLGAEDRGRPSPFPHLNALTRDTGSLDASGAPLIFDIGARGDAIGTEIVNAVRRVADDVPLDVDAVAEDRPGDAVDALDVIRGVRAVSADPPGGVVAIEPSRFVGVRPATLLTFALEIDITGLPPSTERRDFAARVIFRASGRSRIEVRDIVVVVPGDDGTGCDESVER